MKTKHKNLCRSGFTSIEVAIVVGIVLVLASIYYTVSRSNIANKPTATSQSMQVPADFTVSLKKSGCYGTCPVYSLQINPDMKGTYDGKNFVKVKGQKDFSVSKDEAKEILNKINEINFFSLEDEYINDQTMDASTATISVMADGRSKTIQFQSQQSLDELASKIQALVDLKLQFIPTEEESGNYR